MSQTNGAKKVLWNDWIGKLAESKSQNKINVKAVPKKQILSMKPAVAVKKSPYEAYKNYRVFKDFFNIKIIENSLYSSNNFCDHKYKAVKLS